MRFGIREICNVVFRAKTKQKLGSRTFFKDEPVLYFDTLKTSNLEGAATTVYAQGGRGNPRLIAWEGERTLTFTMEDALLSPEGLSILTGAGLIAANEANSGQGMFVHTTDTIEVLTPNTIVLPKDFACWSGTAIGDVQNDETLISNGDKVKDYQHPSADIFVMVMDDSGNIAAEPCIPAAVKYEYVPDKTGKLHKQTVLTCFGHEGKISEHTIVFVDYYVKHITKATQIEITADKFGGSYYIEADTLFRREGDNYDMPATFVIPNGKVQSNFTFAMAATGDPSTFTFTVDAMPDYTKFDRTHKILAGILILEDDEEEDEGSREPCFPAAVTTEAPGVIAKTIKNTNTEAEVEISGSNVKENAKKNPTFNKDGQINNVNAIVATIPLELGSQVVCQTNPALVSYDGDEGIYSNGSTYMKTKRYTVTDSDTSYEFLVTDNTTPITIKIYAGDAIIGTTGTVTGTPKKTYTINPKVTFA